MSLINSQNFQHHPFHLVSPSPWPFFTSLCLLNLTTSFVLTMHGFEFAGIFLAINLLNLIYVMGLWFSDMITEATYMGNHTLAVQKGMNLGVALFMVSEALFFLAMFWAYFHSALAPTVEVGAHWPPMGIQSINPFELPALNTVMLLASGVTITFAHHSIMQGMSDKVLPGCVWTICLAVLFTALQGMEYKVAPFTMSDATYGSCFYFGTGFHGLHVMIGTAFIAVAFWSILAYHLTDNHHLGYESSILYWHFVDIVWLFLFLSVYFWGS